MSKINPTDLYLAEPYSHAAGATMVTEAGTVDFDSFLTQKLVTPAGSVAILCRDPAISALTASRLDGFARIISILPWDEEPARLQNLIDLGGFEVVISDDRTALSSMLADGGLSVLGLKELETCSRERQRQLTTEWLVPTSGTTSSPKLVRHTSQSLAQVAFSASSVTDRQEVWGLLYDLSCFAGLQVLFQSVFRGKTLVAPPTTWNLDSRIDFLATHSVTHLSATPTLWRKILMSPYSSRLKLQQITLGGEAADQNVLSALRTRFPEARVTHVYASTESGVGFWVSDGKAGFPSDFLKAQPGKPELAIREGRLHVRSSGAASTYSDGQPIQLAGWVDTGDLIEVKGDRFFIAGRENQVLNVGGDKVLVESVRSVLLSCPEVEDVNVYGQPNPITGTLVACEVVLSAGVDEQSGRRAIDSYSESQLSRSERPRIIRFVSELKTNSTGKAHRSE